MKYNYKYKHELKQIDSELKAYFLGFMYGDGCISKKGNEFTVRISIEESDSYILDKFVKDLSFFLPSKSCDYSKYNSKCKKQKYICISSGPVARDLMQYGLVPRKSYENKNKLRFPRIPPQLENHFIRGFFDADGSVYPVKKRPHLRFTEMGTVSRNFILQLKSVLKKNGINFFYKTKMPKRKARQRMHILYLMRSVDVLKFRDYLYQGAEIFLMRKKTMFNGLRIVDKVSERKIECPYCNSVKTWFNGIRGPSRRFWCSSCDKNFSKRLK